MASDDPEQPLRGLITAAVRVGATVRRPAVWDVGYAIWQFTPLRDDAGLRRTGWPQIPDRLARAAALAGGYGLDRAARRRVAATIAPMIRLCAASIVAKAEAGQPAFARLVTGTTVLADMAAEARYAASQEPALRRRLEI